MQQKTTSQLITSLMNRANPVHGMTARHALQPFWLVRSIALAVRAIGRLQRLSPAEEPKLLRRLCYGDARHQPHITTIQSGRVPEDGRVRDWPMKVTRLVAQVSRVLVPEG